MTEKTLAQALREEDEQLHRRFVHATRRKGPLTLERAIEECRRMPPDPAHDGETGDGK
jgi:hypothetical protein